MSHWWSSNTSIPSIPSIPSPSRPNYTDDEFLAINLVRQQQRKEPLTSEDKKYVLAGNVGSSGRSRDGTAARESSRIAGFSSLSKRNDLDSLIKNPEYYREIVGPMVEEMKQQRITSRQPTAAGGAKRKPKPTAAKKTTRKPAGVVKKKKPAAKKPVTAAKKKKPAAPKKKKKATAKK